MNVRYLYPENNTLIARHVAMLSYKETVSTPDVVHTYMSNT